MTEATGRAETLSPIAVRVVPLLVYAGALSAYVVTVGLPKQSWVAVIWLWLLTIAWDVRKPVREHLAFLRDWSLPVALLLLYLYSRGISDDLGFASVHVTEPIDADRWLFGGTLPTEWLQARLCGEPCIRASPPAWYDVLLTTVYYSHFFVALSIAAILWMRNRPEWVRYMRRYLALNFLALIIYIVYPMAPPWMASRDGYLTDDIARITGRGWWEFGRGGGGGGGGGTHQSISAVGNQVAAMPSLHAGIAILVAAWAITRLRGTGRWLLVLYPLAMSFMLVYYAEHYVVDIIAGGICVAIVLVGWTAWERRRGRGSQRVVGAPGTETS
ncbi:phosphatase PAP2 family protein [Nocardioides carbamazepini]|uniref:phosphatase PAP2 family protein n=1 Tax=Nocardioides carbamazepini TaxID=2854259 RepID=UPI002149AF26|nr:phosphatase PAP2 family protein [Nocardioides carbamazepini]MCR1781619.1 phosphatase PAP2 family protein [Nocardioides carbamazepini]